MAQSRDFIPGPDAEFDPWLTNLVNYVQNKTLGTMPPWPHIPVERFAVLRGARDEWHAAFAAVQGPHTRAGTDLKNSRRRAATRELRAFVKQYLRFPPVSNEDRDNMGIPNYDAARASTGAPSTRPEFRLVVKGVRLIAVVFRDAGSASRAKPYGVAGAVIRWSSVLDPSPQALDAAAALKAAAAGDPKAASMAFQHSLLATRSPHLLAFTEAERGRTVYVTLSWRNESGEGTMTEVQSTVVP
ncbi:MAG: hypothetical protein LBG57_14570 [Treponema sp.]|jgi:hypothetical protein|nr:hypothetical protein [Treponema sp.]